MKRIFVQVGITLVGMIAWLLPNQAKAHDNCSTTVNGNYIAWSCPQDDQCKSTVILSNPPTVETSCA